MKNFNEKDFYKKKIIEMVGRIENQDILKYLYSFIESFLKKYK